MTHTYADGSTTITKMTLSNAGSGATATAELTVRDLENVYPPWEALTSKVHDVIDGVWTDCNKCEADDETCRNRCEKGIGYFGPKTSTSTQDLVSPTVIIPNQDKSLPRDVMLGNTEQDRGVSWNAKPLPAEVVARPDQRCIVLETGSFRAHRTERRRDNIDLDIDLFDVENNFVEASDNSVIIISSDNETTMDVHPPATARQTQRDNSPSGHKYFDFGDGRIVKFDGDVVLQSSNMNTTISGAFRMPSATGISRRSDSDCDANLPPAETTLTITGSASGWSVATQIPDAYNNKGDTFTVRPMESSCSALAPTPTDESQSDDDRALYRVEVCTFPIVGIFDLGSDTDTTTMIRTSTRTVYVSRTTVTSGSSVATLYTSTRTQTITPTSTFTRTVIHPGFAPSTDGLTVLQSSAWPPSGSNSTSWHLYTETHTSTSTGSYPHNPNVTHSTKTETHIVPATSSSS